MSTIRVTLIAEERLFRETLRDALSREDDLQLAAEAGDARDALAEITRTGAEVAVLDLHRPAIPGLGIARELRRRSPRCAVVLLSAELHEALLAEALWLGVRGYVTTDQPFAALTSAIRTVHRGEDALPVGLSPELIARLRQQRTGPLRELSPLTQLSPREREVLELMLGGLSYEAIASRLFISRRTVETHRAHLLKKLGVHSLAELFHFAARHGLLRAQPPRPGPVTDDTRRDFLEQPDAVLTSA